MKHILSIVLALALVAALVPGVSAEEAAAPPKPAKKVGDMVPEWSGTNLVDSSTIKSSDLKGKTYALVFVNSSCSACRGEMKDLAQMTFGKKMEVFLVSLDAKPARSMKVYKDMLELPYPVLDDSGQGITPKVSVYSTPASAIVGPDGKLAHRFMGYAPQLKEEIMGVFKQYAD